MSAPKVPTPVLLGPVDRIGGHRVAEPALVVGTLDETIDDFASASTEKQGNVQVTKVSASSDDTNQVTRGVALATSSQSGVDVRVDKLEAGGYVMFAGGSTVVEKWVGIKGRAVNARGVR